MYSDLYKSRKLFIFYLFSSLNTEILDFYQSKINSKSFDVSSPNC